MFDETVVGHAITKRQQADRSSMRPETGALPTQLLPQSAETIAIFHHHIFLPSIFLPNPSFASFCFFGLSPENQLSVFSVSREKEKETKNDERMRSPYACYFAVPILTGRKQTRCLKRRKDRGSMLDPCRATFKTPNVQRSTLNAQRATLNAQVPGAKSLCLLQFWG